MHNMVTNIIVKENIFLSSIPALMDDRTTRRSEFHVSLTSSNISYYIIIITTKPRLGVKMDYLKKTSLLLLIQI